MRSFLTLTALLALSACASITASSEQDISVTTTPAGAYCTLTNQVGHWTIASTPGTASVHRSFSPLVIACEKEGSGKGSASLSPKTRGRSYGNILLLGFPAYVDASTGAGYEYAPDSASITLNTK